MLRVVQSAGPRPVPGKRRFDSVPEHHAYVAQLAEAAGSNPVLCRFDLLLRHPASAPGGECHKAFGCARHRAVLAPPCAPSCVCSPIGRGTSLRTRMLEVRVLSGTPYYGDSPIGRGIWSRTRSVQVRILFLVPGCMPSPIGRGSRLKPGSVRVRISRRAQRRLVQR